MSSLRETGNQEGYEVEAIFAAHVVGADRVELVKKNYCVNDVEFYAERLELRDRSRI